MPAPRVTRGKSALPPKGTVDRFNVVRRGDRAIREGNPTSPYGRKKLKERKRSQNPA